MKKLQDKYNEEMVKINIQLPESWVNQLRILAAQDTISGKLTSFQDKIRIAIESYLSVRGNKDERPY